MRSSNLPLVSQENKQEKLLASAECDSLAWYHYPEPHGRWYSASELCDPKIVEEVFNYCQILLALITASGWQYLFKTHGIDGLIVINQRSGWFDDSEAVACIRYTCLTSGYDPNTDEFGECDDSITMFTPDNGSTRLIDWDS